MGWKKLAKWLLLPHPAFLWLFAPSALALLIYTAIFYESTDVISIVSYVCSFCALVLVCLRVPDIIRAARRFWRENRYAARYSSDLRLRVSLSLYSALTLNALYAVFQLGLGIRHHSVWFYSMAGYYLLLAALRLMLAKYTRLHAPGQYPEKEWRKYRICGIFLMLTTVVLTVFILYFILRIREFRHHEITCIAMAAYTFSSLALAISGAFRYRKYGSPVCSAAKAISLVSAAVSVLTLENTMLTSFGQAGDENFRRLMLGASGAAVVLAVEGIALYMIVNAGKKLRELRSTDH